MKSFSLVTSARAWMPATLAIAVLATGCATTTNNEVRADDKAHAAGAQDQDHGAMPLPPGWTEADMQACMVAGMPGPMHQHLAKNVGTWTCTSQMWMAPGMAPLTSTNTQTVQMVMDGRYAKCEFEGTIPGMGAFHGIAYNGFDNVSQKFVGTWLDNHSSGIMTGTGELSADGKTMTWSFTYNCPILKRPAVMREVDTYTSDDTMTMEMFGTDPKTGVEYKMMKIDMKRTSKSVPGT